MEYWQINFKLLPEDYFDAAGGIAEGKLIGMMAGIIPGYINFELPDDYSADLNKFLPLNIASSDQMEHWGDDRSDGVKICRGESGQIQAIEVQVDARKLNDETITWLLELVKRWKCVLVETTHQTALVE